MTDRALERLRADLSRLFFLANEMPTFTVSWWTQAEERACAARDYAMVDPADRDFRFSKKMRDIDDPHRLGILAHEVGHVLAFQRWQDESEDGADRASAELLKLPIYYDHAYGAGGKGLQTLRPPRKNPYDREAFERELDERRKKNAGILAAIEKAFAASAAVIAIDARGDKTLYIVSGDTMNASRVRVSRFAEDGPLGHFEADTLQEIVEHVALEQPRELVPVGDDEVIAWTTTPTFLEGSRHVAYQQAWNEIGWLASQRASSVERERLYEARRLADELVRTDGIDAGVRALHATIAAIRDIKPNPSFDRYRNNPTPWVTKVLANTYEQLEGMVPPAWLPKLTKTTNRRSTFTGKLEEFGCGVYGCVLPTLDPMVVLKVTSDTSETDFARRLAPHLPTPIVTEYFRVADIEGVKRQGDPIALLWRESADRVGKIDVDVGPHAEDAIALQHGAAKDAFLAMLAHKPKRVIDKLMQTWRHACQDMGHVPELEFVSEGLLAAEKIGIFISDVHGGNLGLCMRHGAPTWVITDPGNVVVTSKRFAR